MMSFDEAVSFFVEQIKKGTDHKQSTERMVAMAQRFASYSENFRGSEAMQAYMAIICQNEFAEMVDCDCNGLNHFHRVFYTAFMCGLQTGYLMADNMEDTLKGLANHAG